MNYRSARIVNVVLGLWLFLSAFLWPHSAAQMTNTWSMGLLCVVIAIVAMTYPVTRFANSVLGVWVFLSAFALPTTSSATMYNNALVGIAIFIVSLIPSTALASRSRSPLGRVSHGHM